MNPKFLIEQNGRTLVLYSGLLDLAHEKGLLSIETSIVQLPQDSNGLVAVCEARVRMAGPDGVERTFTGIGDACPSNVSRMMVPHLLRMSETRSKARALRDAVNVGVAAFEEVGEDEPPARAVTPSPPLRHIPAVGASARPPTPRAEAVAPPADEPPPWIDDGPPVGQAAPAPAAPAPRVNRPAAPVANGPASGRPASPKQVETVQRMAKAAGKTIPTEGLTMAQASELISGLIGEMGNSRTS